MAISSKIQNALSNSSSIRKMFEEGARLRQIHGAENVYDFTLGNPSVEPPVALHQGLRRLAEAPPTGMHQYMNNAGYDETRAAVAEVLAERSQQPVGKEHVIMTCGAGGALNIALKTILNPGDEVIILTPFFVDYKFYIDNHGGVSREVQTEANTFQLDLAAIEAAINERTRALILNSPTSPTGVVYPAESLKKLGELLRRKQEQFGHTLYVISDEPYARLSYDVEVPNIFTCVRNAIIATSYSKDLALPGERIGYLAANPQLEEVELFMAGAIFCNRVLGFVNAPALMQRLVTPLQRASVDLDAYRRKRDLLYDRLTALGFEMVKPQGGFYLFPRSPLTDDIAFVQLAQKHNILLVPGSGFGAPGYFRIAYCIDEAIIERSFPAWEALANEVFTA